ncbi:hypothetical protein EVG20_g8003 [Dentipellis fragilis]|uniref:J domain-containing protein n=1 Tax=Dentipellis fragilis TaxID=205917 RepID=A0A4Y9YB81_9AGAM|nr:hypothetical protein EVG20_g8003 [Dentipellis fragilis]
MAHVISLPVVPPPLPKDWAPAPASGKTIAPLVERTLIPAGPAYLAHVRRAVHNISFEEHDKHVEAERQRLEGLNGSGANGEDDLGVGDEEESDHLLMLDPKDWKNQDHYAVLGLSHLRYQATDEQIKIAHRKKVLKHHPDKKAGVAGDANDDAFFNAANSTRSTRSSTRSRTTSPTASEVKKAKDPHAAFFTLFAPVFEREARFSRKQPVPPLGAYDAAKADVEGFYDFWYNFDSWRSFEYLDKEVNEGSDNRDDKRYTEKKNKSERARRKKEDTARLRGIVDLALSLDPRIKRIKQEEKEAREAKRKTKAGTGASTPSAAQVEEEKRRAAEEAQKKEEEEKAAKADAKKAKAAAANAAKKARRAQRATEEGTAS